MLSDGEGRTRAATGPLAGDPIGAPLRDGNRPDGIAVRVISEGAR
jgi:hypothetical protein